VGVSDAVISQTDLLTSLTAVAGVTVPQASTFDSQNVMPALMGQSEHGRDVLVEADVFQRTAIRQGRWKLLDLDKPSLDRPGLPAHATGTNCELYDLQVDPGETANVAAQHPDVVGELWKKLQQIRRGA
jgi:arylsulfatase A-like enzyme